MNRRELQVRMEHLHVPEQDLPPKISVHCIQDEKYKNYLTALAKQVSRNAIISKEVAQKI